MLTRLAQAHTRVGPASELQGGAERRGRTAQNIAPIVSSQVEMPAATCTTAVVGIGPWPSEAWNTAETRSRGAAARSRRTVQRAPGISAWIAEASSAVPRPRTANATFINQPKR